MTQGVEHPPQAGGDPGPGIVVHHHEAVVADADLAHAGGEHGRGGQRMPPEAADMVGPGRRAEVRVEVQEDRAGDVAGLVRHPAIPGPEQVPAGVDHPEPYLVLRIVEAAGEVADGDQAHRPSMADGRAPPLPPAAERR